MMPFSAHLAAIGARARARVDAGAEFEADELARFDHHALPSETSLTRRVAGREIVVGLDEGRADAPHGRVSLPGDRGD